MFGPSHILNHCKRVLGQGFSVINDVERYHKWCGFISLFYRAKGTFFFDFGYKYTFYNSWYRDNHFIPCFVNCVVQGTCIITNTFPDIWGFAKKKFKSFLLSPNYCKKVTTPKKRSKNISNNFDDFYEKRTAVGEYFFEILSIKSQYVTFIRFIADQVIKKTKSYFLHPDAITSILAPGLILTLGYYALFSSLKQKTLGRLIRKAAVLSRKFGKVTISKKSAYIEYAANTKALRFGAGGVKISMMRTNNKYQPIFYSFAIKFVLFNIFLVKKKHGNIIHTI